MCTPLSAGGGGVEPPTKFSKRGAWHDLKFYRGVAGKEGGDFFQVGGGGGGPGCNCHIKNKLKSEIFNDKKALLAKIFFSVMTKNCLKKGGLDSFPI